MEFFPGVQRVQEMPRMLNGVPRGFRSIPRFWWCFRDVPDVTGGSRGFYEHPSDAPEDFEASQGVLQGILGDYPGV